MRRQSGIFRLVWCFEFDRATQFYNRLMTQSSSNSARSGSAPPSTPLTAWLDSSLGQTVLTKENYSLRDAVRRIHGDTLLWAGVSAGTAGLSRRSMVRQRIFLAPNGVARADLKRAENDGMCALSAQLHELPLRNNCVDALVLHHTLELSEDPRGALREAARVLQPGGQMVICAFNQLALFSLFRSVCAVPGNYLSPWRLREWLDVLGFEPVVGTQHLLYRPPWALESFGGARWDRLRGALHRLAPPAGNVVVLHVRKKSLSIRPDWKVSRRPRVALSGAGAAYPKLVDSQRKVR